MQIIPAHKHVKVIAQTIELEISSMAAKKTLKQRLISVQS